MDVSPNSHFLCKGFQLPYWNNHLFLVVWVSRYGFSPGLGRCLPEGTQCRSEPLSAKPRTFARMACPRWPEGCCPSSTTWSKPTRRWDAAGAGLWGRRRGWKFQWYDVGDVVFQSPHGRWLKSPPATRWLCPSLRVAQVTKPEVYVSRFERMTGSSTGFNQTVQDTAGGATGVVAVV